MAVSERYFDHHQVLFPEQANELDEQIQRLEKLVKLYNCLKQKLPEWTAIDMETLRCSVREETMEKVAEAVAIAKWRTAQDYAERENAWKIVQPYILAQLEKSSTWRPTEGD